MFVGSSVLDNKPIFYISTTVPGMNAAAAVGVGATNIQIVIPAQYLTGVIE